LPNDLTNLQQRVAGRLKAISANDLQKLAEQLALTLRPDLFNRATLVVQGRNVEDQTTKGWPDAYAEAPQGLIYAIEATRQKSSWEVHVREDLVKATGAKNRKLAGYFFVGGYPDHEPTEEEQADWINKFAAIGISPTNISLLVGLNLVTALMAPECAKIRYSILHLSESPRRFALLRPGAIGSSSDLWQPSPEDYENRRVFEPPLLTQVIDRLKAEGRVLIRGHGAAGKTTLAHLVAASADVDPSPVYYLNLENVTESFDHFRNEAIEDFVEFAGDGVIFVIDNIHLAESLTTELAREWRDIAKPSNARLLLLGREQRTVHGTPLGDLKPLVMRAGAAELQGVVRRLLGRKGHLVPEASDTQLQDWIRIFGGDPKHESTSVDLIAFSAAAERRLDSLALGDFRLKPEDAVDGVRTRYLKPVRDDGERANLVRLAALAVLEIAPADENLPRPDLGFPISSTNGLVFSEPVGSERRIQHRLAHPALGDLLLHAFAITDGGRAERLAAAKVHTPLAFRIAARAIQYEERRESKNIAITFSSNARWIKSSATLNDVVSTARALLRAKATTPRELDDALSQSADFIRLLRGTRAVENWIQLLSIAKHQDLTKTLQLVRHVSNEDSNGDRLIDMLSTSSAHLVAGFLRIHPVGASILTQINAGVWNRTQSQQVRAILATEAVSAMRFFESRNRLDLAHSPANRQVVLADPKLWFLADMAHLSHTIRLSNLSETEFSGLLKSLGDSGWLNRAVERTSSGSLTGAVLSLFNHLPHALLQLLPLDALETRLNEELKTALQGSAEPALRALSMLGTVSEMIPTFRPPSDVVWPSTKEILAMISARARKDDRDQLGTHEIQLWLGLMRMAQVQSATVAINNVQGERVLRLLEATQAPTSQANAARLKLLSWLKDCAARSWMA
jgi:hypothetical protein